MATQQRRGDVSWSCLRSVCVCWNQWLEQRVLSVLMPCAAGQQWQTDGQTHRQTDSTQTRVCPALPRAAGLHLQEGPANLTDIHYASNLRWHLFCLPTAPKQTSIQREPCVQIVQTVVYQTPVILTQHNNLFMAIINYSPSYELQSRNANLKTVAGEGSSPGQAASLQLCWLLMLLSWKLTVDSRGKIASP